MHELQKQFHKFINERHLINSGEKVLLAVSGGLDSMVMLDLFLRSSYDIAGAHCNFGLRGTESDADEELVTSTLQKKSVASFVEKVRIEGASIQLEARQKRYEWFNKISTENGFSKIATAHHLNDSLETTLFNLTRGSGIRGLSGIPLQNKNIIRPLINFSKSELLAYAEEMEVVWREDATNALPNYTRNRIRIEVVPKLKEINSSFEQTFRNTKERLTLVADLVEHQVGEILSMQLDPQCGELQLGWINREHDLLILSEILVKYGFNYVTSKEVFEAIGQSGKIFESAEWKLMMDRKSLFIKKRDPVLFNELLIDNEGIFKLKRKKLAIGSFPLDEEDPMKVASSPDEKHVVLDRSKLTFPLKVRKWREGDFFQPLGMKGRKKISDFLIDLKLPHALKGDVLVLESNDEIAWVIGFRISEKFKVSDDSIKAISLKISE